MRFQAIIVVCLLYFSTCAGNSYAQTFYANTSDSIRQISISGRECTVKDIPVGCVRDFFSMALYHDTLYFLSVNDGLWRTLLSRPGKCEKVMDLRPLNSLTADKNGMLYGAMANSFVKIDTRSKTTEEYFMPYPAAGDLVFYESKLYVAASPDIIAEINIEDPAQSTILMALGQGGVYGLTSMEGSCKRNRVFALATNGRQTQLIELDMENKKSLGVKCTIDGTYHDAASITETGDIPGLQVSKLEKRDICLTSVIPSFLKVVVTGSSAQLTYQLNNTLSNDTGVFENLVEGKYTVHITSREGCFLDTAVTITKGYCDVILPSAFTPNGDKLNDIFKPLGFAVSGDAVFCIYNAWGKKIFQTGNVLQGWDGKVNDVLQQTGTYVWTFTYTKADNTTEFLKGTVVLLK